MKSKNVERKCVNRLKKYYSNFQARKSSGEPSLHEMQVLTDTHRTLSKASNELIPVNPTRNLNDVIKFITSETSIHLNHSLITHDLLTYTFSRKKRRRSKAYYSTRLRVV